MGLPPARHKKSMVSGSSSTTRQPSPPCEEIEQDEEPNVTSSSSSSFFHDSHHHHAGIRRNTCQHRPHSKHGNSRNAFQKALSEKGLEEVEQEGDGNCLFRAVGLQVYGDSDSHMEVRRRCMDFMAKEQAHFAQFVPTHEPFQTYIERKRKDGVHGNNPEIQAISELYNRPVQVYIPSHGATPINIFQSEYKTSDIPIRLAYHDGNHYNAIVDPFLPTAGLGLGLPGLEPGLADKLQMQRAKQESDRIFINQIARQTHDMELKRAMEESSKLASMDYWMMLPKKRAFEYSTSGGTGAGVRGAGGDDDLTDATANFELQEQIALLSSLESCRGHGHGHGHGHESSSKATTLVVPEEESQKMSGKECNHPTKSENESRNDGNGNNGENDCCSSLMKSPNKSFIDTNHATDTTDTTANCSPVAATPSSNNGENQTQTLNQTQTNQIIQDEEEYPRTVQELVMNGFKLSKVLKAYELIGDNFDDLLCYLMMNNT